MLGRRKTNEKVDIKGSNVNSILSLFIFFFTTNERKSVPFIEGFLISFYIHKLLFLNSIFIFFCWVPCSRSLSFPIVCHSDLCFFAFLFCFLFFKTTFWEGCAISWILTTFSQRFLIYGISYLILALIKIAQSTQLMRLHI